MSTAALVLVCALNLLGRSPERFPPIVLLDDRPGGVSVDADAFARRDPDAIFLLTGAPAFSEAAWAEKNQGRCSDRDALARVASIVVHEEWHLLNGADERGAYQAQLTALAMLGFGPGSRLHNSVKRAMQLALERSRRPAVEHARVYQR